MNRVLSVSRILLLSFALIGAWMPAAMSARTTSAARAPAAADVQPASHGTQESPAAAMPREA